MPEIHQLAPHAVYVPRKGEVNAWDNDDFVAQVEATGRRTLVMAGVWTSVCVMFPALDAKSRDMRSMRWWMPRATPARWLPAPPWPASFKVA
ncbi:isochorismatase family protein [Xanthobacter wiegelii]|uniref:isochorismatase family protein n=1 Tax=Xanthobacter wiegelii TaxID=3119913 RepID=UPI00372AB666